MAWLLKVAPLALLATAAVTQPKLAPSLDTLDPDSTVDVIVQYAHVPTVRHHQKVLELGGSLKRQLDIIRGGHYAVPVRALRDLAEDADVVHISPDRALEAAVDSAEVAVNANIAFSYGWDGTGVGIAVIDSGISNHPDLERPGGAMRIVFSQDFVGGGTNDFYGHGQHVAGIAAGNGFSSSLPSDFLTFRGVAPKANLINLRVLDQNGRSTDSTVIAAIQQAIALKNKYNIRVINLSLGRPVFESYLVDPLCQAVEQAWRAGIVVVVAAGNQGRDNFARHQRLWNDSGTRQRSLCHHRRGHANDGHAVARGRSDRQLQLQRPHADRPHCEAGPGGARKPGGVAAGLHGSTRESVSQQHGASDRVCE